MARRRPSPSRFPGGRTGGLALPCLALALTSTSCIPAVERAAAPRIATAIAAPAADPLADLPAPLQVALAAAPAEAPAALIPAAAHVFEGRTPLDRLRSLDCLAEAVYYEARSESEDGQRAVAQVVLNRVRHPAWPNSVCGVVYQGPMRAGGGCQFTFTCDGSLAVRPRGPGWAKARSIARAALSGATYAPVGLSTHYHTFAVAPHWAPALARTAEIGAHRFYRLPGTAGAPTAFRAAYSGSEPLPVPSVRSVPRPSPAAKLPDWFSPPPAAARTAAATTTAPPVPEEQPSTVREEYRHSGQWRADAPAAITGAR